MAISAALDYTTKDFPPLLARLQELAQSEFPDWTDFEEANFGNVLLSLFAHVGDILTFYQDNQALESKITTATQRRSLLGLIKLIGYEARGAASSSVLETFTLSAIPVGSVTFPAGTFVSTGQVTTPVRFQLLSPLIIAGGANPPVGYATVEHSKTFDETFTSNSLANQEFLLTNTPYLDASLVVVAADGTYTEVDNFLSSTSVDKHFTVSVDQNDRALLRFGNAINGALPQGSITCTYKTGGGAAGNVAAGTLNRIEGSFADSFGNPVRVAVTNALAASGGADRETIAQIKQNAPLSLTALLRSVARTDFEINALRVPGVARALMLTRNEDPGIAENTGILFIVPAGGGTPSPALLTTVFDFIQTEYPPTLTFALLVQVPLYKTINVRTVVFLRAGAVASVVKAAIIANLQTFFAIENEDGSANTTIDFGFNYTGEDGDPDPAIAWSDVFNEIRDTTGVRKISDNDDGLYLNGVNDDILLLNQEFPVLGTITIINGATGLPL